jgi:hypothetical protein
VRYFLHGKAIQVAQFERPTQRGRELLYELKQMPVQFRVAALFFRTWSGIRQTIRPAKFLIFPGRFIDRHMGLARPSPQLHPCTIRNNRGEPCRHLGLTLELAQVFVSGQQRILNRILRVGSVAQLSIGISVETR